MPRLTVQHRVPCILPGKGALPTAELIQTRSDGPSLTSGASLTILAENGMIASDHHGQESRDSFEIQEQVNPADKCVETFRC